MKSATPVCTVIVSVRDRFSPTAACLDNLFAATPEPVDFILVLGGAPAAFREEMTSKYGGRVEIIFEDRFLNCAEARNRGLRAAKTRFAACLDNDVYPREGWLSPLLRCQRETGAGLVVPLILENARAIHAAGNRLFVTRRGGKAFGAKVLPYYKQEVYEGTNLPRQHSDYGEMHCQLMDAPAALALGVLDERVQEGEELDSGLAWKAGGREIWLEPESIVVYDFPLRLEDPDDIPIFKWRWNIRNLIPGYLVMHEKWGMDLTENGDFKYFLLRVNGLLGILPRIWPTKAALVIDNLLGRAAALTAIPGRVWSHLRAWSVGYYDWVVALEDPRPPRVRIAGELRRLLPWAADDRRRVRIVPISEGVRLEVFWREDELGRGPGASLHSAGTEVLRVACLGDGKGHFLRAPASRKRWDVERRYFAERGVEDQIRAALSEIRADLFGLDVESAGVARACARAGEMMRAYAASAGPISS